MKLHKFTHIIASVALIAMMCACANIGSPEGGPRDYDPPVLMRTSPQMGATNFTGNKVEIVFDEIVQLKDQQKNLIISPVQKEQPIVKCLGKRIVVEFRDEMQPNTTYCIDFGNAIEDNNEGNPLRNFAFSFSTGSEIDTLEMSGIALWANDLEPVQYALVGLHSNLDDTAFTSLPFERVCRTNDRGQFTLRNLKPGNYHVFALNDMDGDFKMARSEDVAFLDYTVSPSASIVTSQDTTFTFDHKIDTIVTAQHTQFLPNDLLLDVFNSNYRSLYLKKNERIDSTRMHILFSNATQMPDIKLIKPVYYSDKPWYVLQNNERNDSLFLWITDLALVATDSLAIEMTYLQTDKNDSIILKTDTLNFVTRRYNADIKKAQQEAKKEQKRLKEIEKYTAELFKLREQGKDTTDVSEQLRGLRDSAPKPPRLELSIEQQGQLDVGDSIALRTPVPLSELNQQLIKLEMMNPDSTWVIVDAPLKPANQYELLRYTFQTELQPATPYRLRIEPNAAKSIYGLTNDTIKSSFSVKSLEEYGNITLRLNAPHPAIVQLLDSRDTPVRTVKVENGVAKFNNIVPSDYYARVILDTNENGRWDTGDYLAKLQPEHTLYYPKRLRVRKNWELDENWDVFATPLDTQKPDAIKKNKPNKSRNKFDPTNKKTNNEEDDDDEFNSNSFGRNTYSGNKYQDFQNARKR